MMIYKHFLNKNWVDNDYALAHNVITANILQCFVSCLLLLGSVHFIAFLRE